MSGRVRHLTVLHGGGHALPEGTVRPTRSAMSNVRRRPTGQVPVTPPGVRIYDRTTEPDETVFVPLTPVEWSLIVESLAERGQGNSLRIGSQSHAELAVKVREMVRSRTLHPVHQPVAATPSPDPRALPRPI